MSTSVQDRPTDAAPPPSDPPPLAPLALARWLWRQLVSMRTALILLMLLALAAVPGSVVPQTGVDAQRVTQWRVDHPTLAPIYDRLGLFDVYGSAWFAAIYLLLVVSLVGCIVPRTAVYWRSARATPPAAPRRLERMPDHRTWRSDETPETVLQRARTLLGEDSGYRLRPVGASPSDTASDQASAVSAERGYLREAGNLLFHLAVLVVLAGFAIGTLFGFKGGVIVVSGDGWSNSVTQYDQFDPGTLFRADDLRPFRLKVDDFKVDFITKGRAAGAATDFSADLTVRDEPGARARDTTVRVNHPLTVDGTKVFLIGHGYAPHITVRDAKGQVVYPRAVPFLPEGADFRSFGVVKVLDGLPSQLGLEGEFYPTYAVIRGQGIPQPFSAFPDAKNPVISMLAYQGNLGLDSGAPQSVYVLDKSQMKPIRDAAGKPVRLDLALGKTATLPDGMGTVTFDGLERFVRLQVSRTPGTSIALGGTVLALVGLCGSLFIRPRRVWLRARQEGDHTIVTLAGLDRSSGGDLTGELDRIRAALAPVGGGPRTAEKERTVEERRT